jgi:hypothetical protein
MHFLSEVGGSRICDTHEHNYFKCEYEYDIKIKNKYVCYGYIKDFITIHWEQNISRTF